MSTNESSPPDYTDNLFTEVQNRLPAESKEHKWKAAPVYGRGNTTMETSLPCNLGNAMMGPGKTIVVNRMEAPRIKGQVPRTADVKRTPARKK